MGMDSVGTVVLDLRTGFITLTGLNGEQVLTALIQLPCDPFAPGEFLKSLGWQTSGAWHSNNETRTMSVSAVYMGVVAEPDKPELAP
jgi:hypothetical protein